MAKKEDFEKFLQNLPYFPRDLNKKVVSEWQEYTEEAFALSLDRVPILTGDLLRSGGIKNAKITSKGVVSSITYTMPYARFIEEGIYNDGTEIDLNKEGYEYPDGRKKARKGQTEYLSSAVNDTIPDAIKEINKAIGKAFDEL